MHADSAAGTARAGWRDARSVLPGRPHAQAGQALGGGRPGKSITPGGWFRGACGVQVGRPQAHRPSLSFSSSQPGEGSPLAWDHFDFLFFCFLLSFLLPFFVFSPFPSKPVHCSPGVGQGRGVQSPGTGLAGVTGREARSAEVARGC